MRDNMNIENKEFDVIKIDALTFKEYNYGKGSIKEYLNTAPDFSNIKNINIHVKNYFYNCRSLIYYVLCQIINCHVIITLPTSQNYSLNLLYDDIASHIQRIHCIKFIGTPIKTQNFLNLCTQCKDYKIDVTINDSYPVSIK